MLEEVQNALSFLLASSSNFSFITSRTQPLDTGVSIQNLVTVNEPAGLKTDHRFCPSGIVLSQSLLDKFTKLVTSPGSECRCTVSVISLIVDSDSVMVERESTGFGSAGSSHDHPCSRLCCKV